MRIGFIGLGAMGLPMAGHLVAAGHEVTVASRSRGPIDAAVSQGAADGGSPRGVAEASEVIMLCVPNSPGGGGGGGRHAAGPGAGQDGGRLLHHRPRGGALPARASRCDAERAISMLRSPVARPAPRRARSLSWSVVTPASWPTPMPALEPFSGLVVHVGGPGMGQVVKLCNQVIYAAQMTATAEATAMAVKSGVDMDKLLPGPHARHRRLRGRSDPPAGARCRSPRAPHRTVGSPGS